MAATIPFRKQPIFPGLGSLKLKHKLKLKLGLRITASHGMGVETNEMRCE